MSGSFAANRLIEFLLTHPHIIPHVATPDVVFFLLSEDNFVRAWRWLGQALQDTRIDVSFIGRDVSGVKQLFSCVRPALSAYLGHQHCHVEALANMEDIAALIYLHVECFHRLQELEREYLRKNSLATPVHVLIILFSLFLTLFLGRLDQD